MYFFSERKKLFKSLFVHASIYPVLVTNKNCYIILQSCNYKKPFIHPCLVFVLFKFFCWGRGGFKMEFCNNLKLLRQEKEGCDLTEKSEQKHLSYRCTHVKVSSQCQQTFTVTKWQTQSWFHEQLTLFISAINSKRKLLMLTFPQLTIIVQSAFSFQLGLRFFRDESSMTGPEPIKASR